MTISLGTASLGTASASASAWTIRASRESPLPAPCLVLVRNDDDGQVVRRHLKFSGATAARRMPCPQVSTLVPPLSHTGPHAAYCDPLCPVESS